MGRRTWGRYDIQYIYINLYIYREKSQTWVTHTVCLPERTATTSNAIPPFALSIPVCANCWPKAILCIIICLCAGRGKRSIQLGLDVYGLWLRLDFAAIFSQFRSWFGIKTGAAQLCCGYECHAGAGGELCLNVGL